MALALWSCDSGDQNNGSESESNTDDADGDTYQLSGCHNIGEAFEPPDSVINPLTLNVADYCCDSTAQEIVIVEIAAYGQCVQSSPLQFSCITENGDQHCETGEDTCTSPIDCAPPNDSYPTCCGEGDKCWTASAEENPISGIKGCCEGLDEIKLDYWDEDSQQCSGLMSEYDVICVKKCGDGECTAGENPCNCPVDCPAETW